MSGWNDIVQNQKIYTLKKFLYQIIENKVTNYEDIISRVGFHLITDNDLKLFAEMIGEVYRSGHMAALKSCEKQLKEAGIMVNLEENQSEKLGW